LAVIWPVTGRQGHLWLQFEVPKRGTYDLLAEGGANLNNISDKAMHSAQRRMVASFYAPKNIDQWEPYVADSMANLLAQMDRRRTKPQSLRHVPDKEELTFDGVHWIFLFSVETIFKIGLSKDVGFLKNGNDQIQVKDANGKIQPVSAIQSIHSVQRAAAAVIFKSILCYIAVSLSQMAHGWLPILEAEC
jgi:hypothetical protein